MNRGIVVAAGVPARPARVARRFADQNGGFAAGAGETPAATGKTTWCLVPPYPPAPLAPARPAPA